VIGAWKDDDMGIDAGAAYAFRFKEDGGQWEQAQKLYGSDSAAGDGFGSGASAAMDEAVVAAHQDDDGGIDSGSAYIVAGISGIDENGDGVADACGSPGDVDGNGVVDFNDLINVILAWGLCPQPPGPGSCPADLSGDGMVDIDDLFLVINFWD
jgi:hypothetical protein